jgi:S1-C subfamily serine protease
VSRIAIGGISCDYCTLLRPADPRQSRWEFSSEPVVIAAERGSAVSSTVRAGDVVVAVDGHLITTPEGGRRFRSPDPGRTVSLRVRRDGRELTVAVQPETECEEVRQRSSAGVQRRGSPIDSVSVSPGVTTIFPSAARAVTMPLLLPEGWLGLSFTCSRCEVRVLGDSARIWSFAEPPSVFSVERNGPAARAGLQNGDRLVSISGLSLTSREGGELFGAVSPGQSVLLEYERNGQRRSTELLVGTRARSGSAGTTTIGISGSRSIAADVVRYSGRVGDTMVEVTGEPVTVIQSEGETVIRSSTITVRLRRAEGGR